MQASIPSTQSREVDHVYCKDCKGATIHDTRVLRICTQLLAPLVARYDLYRTSHGLRVYAKRSSVSTCRLTSCLTLRIKLIVLVVLLVTPRGCFSCETKMSYTNIVDTVACSRVVEYRCTPSFLSLSVVLISHHSSGISCDICTE